jgi:hypothetical protein
MQSSADDDDSTTGDDETAPASSATLRVNPPPPVPPKRLDPLMASLTRVDSATANLPTRNIPFFGEVPVDGSLVVLVPAAVIAVLGLLMSVVVAVNSRDAIVATLAQVSDELSQTAISKSSQTYDDSVCRGICSTQQEDLEGLKTFMNRFAKD